MNYIKKRRSARRFMIVMIILTTIICSCCWFVISTYSRATDFNPNPNHIEITNYDATDEFPVVDWAYWQSINPDMIGWVTVPDTKIDYPIVQAHSWDRDYYLTHDFYKQWNFAGAIYLDADNEEKGFDSDNCVILGHNMQTNRDDMFSAISYYLDENFAKSHKTILLQTPSKKIKLEAIAVDNINGNQAIKQTSFKSETKKLDYMIERYQNSKIKLAESLPSTNQMFTFCSCSYNFNPANERTLIYCFE